MSGWTMVILGGVCASGAVMFLTLVANALHGEQESLRAFETQCRLQQEARSQDTITTVKPEKEDS